MQTFKNKDEEYKMNKKDTNLWSRPISESEYRILYMFWIMIAYICDYLEYIFI